MKPIIGNIIKQVNLIKNSINEICYQMQLNKRSYIHSPISR